MIRTLKEVARDLEKAGDRKAITALLKEAQDIDEYDAGGGNEKELLRRKWQAPFHEN